MNGGIVRIADLCATRALRRYVNARDDGIHCIILNCHQRRQWAVRTLGQELNQPNPIYVAVNPKRFLVSILH